MQAAPEALLSRLYPSLHRKMVVALTAYFGFASLAEAEDLVQDTFAAALKDWRSQGIPDNPEKWLYKVCKNKALNFLKRQRSYQTSLYATPQVVSYQLSQAFSESEIEDNELRMIFACCHPRFSEKAQLILILKSLCGFSTEKVAHNLAMKPEAVRKLHYRTLQIIREEQLPLHTPQLLRLSDRVTNVHRVIYLLFNEGYLAYQGPQLLNDDCCLEALRLLQLMLKQPPICTADTHALYALMLFHLSRVNARTDAAGALVELEHQNRALWHPEMIRLGIHHLNKALDFRQPLGRYPLEALIASLHSTAPSFQETDWQKISHFYDQLLILAPNPFVVLNKAIALYFTENAEAAFAYLADAPYQELLEDQHLYHAFLGRMFLLKGVLAQAKAHFTLAFTLSQNQLEKNYYQQKLALCSRPPAWPENS